MIAQDEAVRLISGLSARKHAILERLAEGQSQRQIAVDFHVSWSTIKHHLREARRYTNANSTLHLVAIYMRARPWLRLREEEG